MDKNCVIGHKYPHEYYYFRYVSASCNATFTKCLIGHNYPHEYYYFASASECNVHNFTGLLIIRLKKLQGHSD